MVIVIEEREMPSKSFARGTTHTKTASRNIVRVDRFDHGLVVETSPSLK